MVAMAGVGDGPWHPRRLTRSSCSCRSEPWVLAAADSYAHFATLPIGLWTARPRVDRAGGPSAIVARRRNSAVAARRIADHAIRIKTLWHPEIPLDARPFANKSWEIRP